MPDNNQDVFINDTNLYNKPTKAIPKPAPEIGVDTHGVVMNKILGNELNVSGGIDLGAIESFTSASQSRDQIYSLMDMMCQDSKVSAVLETYVEDATETNDRGNIVWCESADESVTKYVTYLLDVMNVDKYSYKWVYNLCKYGDLYLRLYRQSDYVDDVLSDTVTQDVSSKKNYLTEEVLKEDLANTSGNRGERINEDVNIVGYRPGDKYVHYMEMASNPAEIFELTKFGKTYAYIKAEVSSSSYNANNTYGEYYQKYSFKKGDIDIHGPTDYVHASLEEDSGRVPEEVNIFVEDKNKEKTKSTTYTVRRGQSLLYNTFKIWRELKLLEDSVILNRITKSSIVRMINVEVGDMAKEEIGPHLQKIKSLIEQKAALNAGNSMNEYTNPGPVENNVYIPTRNGMGALTINSIGGDVSVGSLDDLDYFQSNFYGNLRVPKQYFGITDDNAGFSGGQSLAIISSRYAKMIKRIQNCYLQALTDAINLMLLDKKLDAYVNKFTLRMQEPTTQEEIDRRDNLASKVGIIRDTMDMLNDIEDVATRLKALKVLLANVYTDNDLASIIQAEIDRLEGEQEEVIEEETTIEGPGEETDLGGELGLTPLPTETAEAPESEETTPEEENLPSPEEAASDIDFSNNNQEI